MILAASIFFDINLPNPSTWFYFSGLLAVALFFKFSRLLSMRNLDVLTLYLFAPGLLLLVEGGGFQLTAASLRELRTDGVSEAVMTRLEKLKDKDFPSEESFLQEIAKETDPIHSTEELLRHKSDILKRARAHAFFGYLWLLIASLYFLGRCLLDLALVRRPALGSNLNLSGLAWLGGALFVSLVAVAVRQPVVHAPTKDSTPMGVAAESAQKAIQPYTPIAAERVLALLCHLSVVVALVLIGWRHFDDVHAGMAAATFYLLLPYTFLLLPDSLLRCSWHQHVWPMAVVLWAVFTYRRPLLAGAFLGVGAGTAFFLVFTLPAWVSFYRGRSAGRFLLSFLVFAGLGLGFLGVLQWLNGELPSSLQSDWTKFVWQPWRRPAPTTPGFWQDMPSQSVARMPAVYRVPVFIASMALVAMSLVWPSPKNLAHVIALSAACLIGIQFWYADRGGVYILWYLPLLLLLVFRPNLESSLPPTSSPDGWLARLGSSVGKRVLRLLRLPTPVERVG